MLRKYKNVVVAEQNLGQLAAYLRSKVDEFTPYQFNQVKGQPFVVSELVAAFRDILEPRRTRIASVDLSFGD